MRKPLKRALIGPVADSQELAVPRLNGDASAHGADRAELERARREAERLGADLERAHGLRRAAEQLAHSEAALRREHERDQAVRSARQQAHALALLGLLETVQHRARQLKREVEALRRAADTAARPLPLREAPPIDDSPLRELRRELDQERSARAHLESELARDRDRAAHATGAIEDIGRRLDALRAAASAPPAVPEIEIRQPSRPANPRDGVRADPPVDPAGAVAPDRLAAALRRLREAAAPLEPEVHATPVSEESAGAPQSDAAPGLDLHAGGATASAALGGQTARWLRPTMKRLLGDDPAVAGKVVLHLLPAQQLVAGPVRYDVVVGPTYWGVTVRDDRVECDVLAEPRPLSDVDFRIEGDLAGLARLLVYGALRRRFSRRVARVRGERRALDALDALIRAPLSLGELNAAGVQLDPELTLRLIAGMIDPSWTVGERFALGHESRGGAGRHYLLVRDGSPVLVSRRPPRGPVAGTIMCPDEQLFPLLAGGSAPEATVLGAAEPVAQLRAWIARAQRGA